MESFSLTEGHLKLLRRLNVRCAVGPYIDPKRPYGNSDVMGDLGEILGVAKDDAGEFSPPEWEWLSQMNDQVATALEIVLRHQSFEPRQYVRQNAWNEWEKAE